MSGFSASALSLRPTYLSGKWYNPFPQTIQAGTAPGTSSTKLLPFWLPVQMTLAGLGARVATADATGGVLFGLAIYASDPTTQMPAGTAPLASVLGLSVAASTVVTAALGANVTLPAGLYYLAVQTSSSSAAFTAVLIGSPAAPFLIGSATAGNLLSANTTSNFGIQVTSTTYGTWPDMTSAVYTENAGSGYAVGILKAA